MIQMNLPIAAVRQKMVAEGIDSSIIDSYFTGGIVSAKGDEQSSRSVDMDKYTRMLTMGMPEGAVRQKMVVAKIPTDQIDAYFSNT